MTMSSANVACGDVPPSTAPTALAPLDVPKSGDEDELVSRGERFLDLHEVLEECKEGTFFERMARIYERYRREDLRCIVGPGNVLVGLFARAIADRCHCLNGRGAFATVWPRLDLIVCFSPLDEACAVLLRLQLKAVWRRTRVVVVDAAPGERRVAQG